MIQHQIVVIDAQEFQVTELLNESEDLSWFLLRLATGWVLISSDFGYVELISKATVLKSDVEEVVFTILSHHCDEPNLPERVGLTSDHVKWKWTSALPHVVEHRLKAVRAIVTKAGSLDNARQQIAELNRRDFIDVRGGSPVNMLEALLLSACEEPVKHSTFKLLGRYVVLRVRVALLRLLSRLKK